MTSPAIAVLGTALMLAFAICAVVSAALQILAWTRHAREDVPVSIRALWKPEGFFDPVGLRQIQLARRLLAVGIAAYLSFGFLILVTSILAR